MDTLHKPRNLTFVRYSLTYSYAVLQGMWISCQQISFCFLVLLHNFIWSHVCSTSEQPILMLNVIKCDLTRNLITIIYDFLCHLLTTSES